MFVLLKLEKLKFKFQIRHLQHFRIKKFKSLIFLDFIKKYIISNQI